MYSGDPNDPHGEGDDDNSKDRLPKFNFTMDWAEGPEELIEPERPYDSYMLPQAIIRLGKDQKRDLKTAFDLFDDGTGLMDTTDLNVALHAIDLHLPKRAVKKMIKEVDPLNSGRLCFSEFLRFFENELSKRETRADITSSFHHFDREGKGKVSVDNLREVARSMGDYMDEMEAMDMILGADRDGDGKVNFDEFRKVIQRTTIIPPRIKQKKY